MKKRILLLALLFVNFLMAQVGINTLNPHTSAELDVTSSSKGLLLPRLNTAAIIALTATASEGLIVFNTTTKQFWGFNGTNWQIFTTTTASFGTPTTATFASWEVGGLGNDFGPSPYTGSFIPQISNAVLARATGMSSSGTSTTGIWGGNGLNSPDLATAIAAADYATATITLPSTNVFSFTKISAHTMNRSSAGPVSAQWQYSVNGGTYTNLNSVITVGTGSTNIAEITLSGISALQNITNSTVVFRLVIYGTSSVGGNWYLNNITGNDLEIVGTYQ